MSQITSVPGSESEFELIEFWEDYKITLDLMTDKLQKQEQVVIALSKDLFEVKNAYLKHLKYFEQVKKRYDLELSDKNTTIDELRKTIISLEEKNKLNKTFMKPSNLEVKDIIKEPQSLVVGVILKITHLTQRGVGKISEGVYYALNKKKNLIFQLLFLATTVGSVFYFRKPKAIKYK